MPDKPLSSFEEKPPLSAFEISPDEPSDPNLLSEAVAQKRAEAVTGAKKGIIGGLGFPGDVTKFIGTKLGLQDKDRALPTSEEVSQGAEYLSKRVPAGLAPYLTPPKPEEPSEKTVEFLANPFSWIGPGGFGTKLLSAIGAGVGGDIGSKIDRPGQFPYGEVTGSVIGGAFTPKTIGKVITPGKEIAANRQAAADYLEKEGVTDLTAGQVKGSKALRRAESQFGTAAFSGDVASEKYLQSQHQFTRAALRRVGEDSDTVTREVVDRSFDRIGKEFDRLENNFLEVDQPFKTEVDQVTKDYWNVTDPGKRNEFVRLLNDQIQKWPSSLAMQGPLYKTLRSSISRYERTTTTPEFKEALTGIRNALDDAMERTLAKVNPADVGKWQAVRQQYRNMLVIEKARPAGELGAEGVITPAKLRAAANSVYGRYFRRGKDPFSKLTDAGELLMSPLPTSQTAERGAIHAIPALVGGAGAALVGGNLPGALGLAGGAVLPGVTGRAMLSGPGQNWLKNQLAIEFLKKQSPASLAGIRALLASLGVQNAVGSQ